MARTHANDTPGATLPRRRFLQTVPAAIAAAVVSSPVGADAARQAPSTAPAPQPPQRPQTPPRFDATAIKGAERVIGLDFTDAEEEMLLGGASRNLDSYDTLRALDIPLDTEPAFVFRPHLPGRAPKPGAARRTPLKLSPPPRITVGPSLEELAFLPVTTLASLVAARKVTSTSLTTMYLDRLKRIGPRLNCVVTLTESLAMEQAAAADREIAAGRYRGPLHGIPWGAKDLFATRGIRTTWGAKPYEDQVINTDATVVERLREAGAVLVAKLSMGALAQGAVWFGGTTKNPWNPDRGSSSGSSAGPGAATAAGLVGFAIGTETLGSIISPSSACGVTGLRPTYGRVSRYGAMALSWTMDKIGPMCRSVEDCAVVFNAIYGSDGRDESVVDAPFAWNPNLPLAKRRIGYLPRDTEPAPESANEQQRARQEQQRQIFGSVLATLKKAGASLVPIELPDFPTQAIRFILSAEAAAAFDDLTRSRGIDRLTSQGAGDWPNVFRTHRFVPAVEYIRAQRARTLLMRRMDALMQTCDVFVTPSGGSSLTITNLTGHPAVALKMGFADDMPQAVMFTGRLYDEATLLGVALAYERATTWHTMHPKIA